MGARPFMAVNDVLITVAVPAFRRADMLTSLIKSFQRQTCEPAELLIVDDDIESEAVASVVRMFAETDPRIRLHRNASNLGYYRNFLNILELARGKYVIILGDDDLFASEDALAQYCKAFADHPEVGYVHSNVLQFNNAYELDYAFNHYPSSQVFPPGLPSLRSTWLKSCYIPGIALRKDIDFRGLYPENEMLFPQVELIGKILMTHSSFGISQFLVAGRAHDAQLGFTAAPTSEAKDTGPHSVEELGQIVNELERYCREDLGIAPPPRIDRLVNTFFRQAHAAILPTEKLHGGNRRILKTVAKAIRNDVATLRDVRFLVYFFASLLLPKRILLAVKEIRKRQIVRKKFGIQKRLFESFVQDIRD